MYGDSVDCIMDGLQNVGQAKNQTYMVLVRNSCKFYGVPPNYLEMNNSVFVREEKKNETFIKSLDYFTTKEKEQLFVRSFINQVAIWSLLVVSG